MTCTVTYNEKRLPVIRRTLLCFAALAAAMMLVLGFTVPASASTDGPLLCDPTHGACSWFQAYGNVVYAQDTACDGYSAVTQVQMAGYGIYDNLWNSDGCNSTDFYQYIGYPPEGTTVYYRPCIGVYASHTIVSCNSGWTHGTF
jgi:hypothetical protein